MHFGCVVHPGHKCRSMSQSKVLEQNLMLTSKEKILKREKIKNGLGSQREKIIFPLLFLNVCDTKKKKKTKKASPPMGFSICRVGKVISYSKEKKEQFPFNGVPFLFCYRHATIRTTSMNDCNVDSFNV